MADIIQLLPDHVANQIAAGEVVQRPAAVVKELLENAIDAGGTSIKLIVKDAGKTLIQVIDSGKGMSVTDARLAFERHATSKIRSADDLFDIQTKGFRGEALASIAAIAHVELKTKQDKDEVGTHIKIEGSDLVSQEVVVTPQGTSVAVKNLFFNIPARRKFLKSDAVELRHILDEFHRVALAHPEIEFSMFHNGSEMFQLPSCNVRQRIVNVFGSKTNEKLVPVKEDTEVLKISGFVGKPEYAKKTRGEQFFFVNNRFVKSNYLNHAVNSAFEGLLRDGAHASYFLYLEVDPKTIDINIHPTKTEIKFDDEHTLYALLRSAVKHSLGQFNIAPVLDFDRDNALDTPYNFKDKQALTPQIEVDRSFNPFKEESAASGGVRFNKENNAGWESLYVGLQSDASRNIEVTVEDDSFMSSMFDEKETEQVQKMFQLHNKYIFNTIKSGILVIDQNRAHERILYEEYLQQITVQSGMSQQLLFPITLELSTLEIGLLNGIRSQLEQTGFTFSAFTDEEVAINAVPVGVTEERIGSLFEKLISDVQNEVPDNNFSQSDLLAKSLATSLAIKNGQRLNQKEQEHLLNSLFACKEPSVTPDNRPTFITLSVEDLDKKFV